MTTGGGAELLRDHGAPQRPTFLELFFDLVYVFALLRLSERLVEDLTWDGGVPERRIVVSESGETLLLLLALWWVWSITAWTTDRFDPRRPAIQVVIVGTMFGSMVMAAALPLAFSEHGLIFASAYVAIHIGRSLFLLAVVRRHELRRNALRILFWFGMSAVPWIAGGLAQHTARGALWTLAVALDYTGATLGYPTPKLGRWRTSEWTIAAEHLAERYRQFFLITLGELILVSGLTFSNGAFEADRTAAFAVSFATTALLWRIYFYRAGEVLAAAIASAPDPARSARSASYTHLVMVAGVVATAVGYELVIEHPYGPTWWPWIAVILGGPALFLAGRARFEYAVFGRVSRSRLIGLLVLAAVAPAMVLVPPLIIAVAATLVLFGIAVSDTARARGRPPEAPSPPG